MVFNCFLRLGVLLNIKVGLCNCIFEIFNCFSWVNNLLYSGNSWGRILLNFIDFKWFKWRKVIGLIIIGIVFLLIIFIVCFIVFKKLEKFVLGVMFGVIFGIK